jgi:hypothetical protein
MKFQRTAESDTDADDDVCTTSVHPSSGLRARFKRCNCFVIRLKTTSCQLLVNAPAICAEFIRHVQSFIYLDNTKEENILNMDEVPRYVETEPASTITTRGSRDILLKKGGSSHKCFTFTLIVSAAVLTIKSYVLFVDIRERE